MKSEHGSVQRQIAIYASIYVAGLTAMMVIERSGQVYANWLVAHGIAAAGVAGYIGVPAWAGLGEDF